MPNNAHLLNTTERDPAYGLGAIGADVSSWDKGKCSAAVPQRHPHFIPMLHSQPLLLPCAGHVTLGTPDRDCHITGSLEAQI